MDSEAKPPAALDEERIQRLETALDKATQLMERHLAAGQQTVPARALFFILRDAGYANSTQKQEVKLEQNHQLSNELHHSYGMRR
jgi:hypothetical protein